MGTAQLLLRRSSFLLTPSPLLCRYPVHSSRLQPRAAMAADATSQFQKIQIQRDDTTFDAYIVGKENAPGVVVLQEWWGVDYQVKNHAIHISHIGDGYRALIPDLYRGKVALEVAEAQHLMEGLDWQGAIKDIQASVKWLKENGSPKVGVTGYCMGVLWQLQVEFWSQRLMLLLLSMGLHLQNLLILPRLRLQPRLILGSLTVLLGLQM